MPPMQTVEVDFDTDNPGRWITHCHNTYHLEAGMAFFLESARRVLSVDHFSSARDITTR